MPCFIGIPTNCSPVRPSEGSRKRYSLPRTRPQAHRFATVDLSSCYLLILVDLVNLSVAFHKSGHVVGIGGIHGMCGRTTERVIPCWAGFAFYLQRKGTNASTGSIDESRQPWRMDLDKFKGFDLTSFTFTISPVMIQETDPEYVWSHLMAVLTFLIIFAIFVDNLERKTKNKGILVVGRVKL